MSLRVRGHRTPLLSAASCFGAGILAADLFDVSPAGGAALVGISLAAFPILWVISGGPGWRTALCVILLALAGAASLAARRGALPPDDVTRASEVRIVASVVEPPAPVRRTIRCVVSPEYVIEPRGTAPPSGAVIVTFGTRVRIPPETRYGSRLLLEGILIRPPRRRNPGEFDHRMHCDAAGVSHLLVVRDTAGCRLLPGGGGSPVQRLLVHPLRTAALAAIDRTTPGTEGEFLKGLLLGMRSGIPQSTQDAFVRAGVAHILAVSGSNVAVIAGVIAFGAGLLRLRARIRWIIVTAGILLYMQLTGAQPPVVRATIMAIVVIGGMAFERPVNSLNALGAAAITILALDPIQLFDAGFQLSFSAVISLLLLYPPAEERIRTVRGPAWFRRPVVGALRLMALSLAATLGTLPCTAIWFRQVSIVGLLANVPVVPLSGVSVVLGVLTLLAGLLSAEAVHAVAGVNALLLKFALAITEASGNAPWAALQIGWFRAEHAVPYYLCLAAAFNLRNGTAARRLLLMLLATSAVLVILGALEGARPPLLRVSMLDVGQGDALLVEFPDGATMLIDAGPASENFDAGARVIVPYLRYRGIDRLTMLVVTHRHNDHIGGVPAVLAAVRVDTLVATSTTLGDIRPPPEVISLAARRGMVLSPSASSRVYVLGPAEDGTFPGCREEQRGENDRSLVLMLAYGQTSLLFVGDAGSDAERSLVERYGPLLRAGVLKVGHHGSLSSSSQPFLDSVGATTALVSVGTLNRFGHPSDLVLERFRRAGSSVLRSDVDGCVILESDGVRITSVDWR